MANNRLKKILRGVFGFKNRDLPLFVGEGQEPIIRERSPDSDELALGWAEGKDEENQNDVVQMKGVSQESRGSHFYVVGATRTGKTKFLETLIEQDIKNNLGFGVIDPHGDLTEDIKGYLYLFDRNTTDFLQEQVVLIDPTDETRTVAFNPLERTAGESAARVASELTEAFKKIWKDAWGARMEHLLKNTLIALVENNLTLAELHPFLTDSLVRRKILEKVKHTGCREYFEQFKTQRVNLQNEWMESTLNKVDSFLFDDNLRQMLSSPKSSFNLREIMDEGKILLVKLDKGRFKGNADLLGSLLLAKIQAAAFSRTDLPESKRRTFYLYIDEFQNFATESFTTILAEASKYKLALILAHQNLAQLPPPLRATILSNSGLQAYFRISREDANILAKESFASIFSSPPGWEEYIRMLQELQPRVCFIKNKVEGGVIAIRTIDQPPPRELAGMDEDEFAEEIAKCEIGKNYLRDRKTIEAECVARKKKLLEVEEPENFKEEKKTENINYEEIIKGGENDYVEFKSSIRYDYKQGNGNNKSIEYVIAKTISAFMNVSGGKLFVGVDDFGKISGIENDYALVHNRNRDGFLLQLTQIINHYLGKEFHQYLNIKIIPIEGKDVCVVEIAKSKIPVFLKSENKKEEFYIRASASSQAMSVREANQYINTHFHKK